MKTDGRLFVIVKGGLGNQLFQYAFYKNLQTISRNVILDLYWFKNGNRPLKLFEAFDLPEKNKQNELINSNQVRPKKPFIVRLINRILRKISKYHLEHFIPFETIVTENDIFHPKAYLYINSGILDGYWQSEVFFEDIKSQIPKIFKFNSIRNQSVLKIKSTILSSKRITSLHWRRGDYVGHKSLGIDLEQYFKKALSWLIKTKNINDVYVFTEDTEWVKNRLIEYGLDLKYHFISEKLDGHEDFHELYLMTLCTNNIISNSSFSWWGAYLNQNHNKTVCAPDTWTNSIKFKNRDSYRVPSDWIQIPI